jgi:L-amino acid N-acyltransferase YncA
MFTIVNMSDSEAARRIRDATAHDAAACAAIYAPYITDTAISFEAAPPTAEEMAARISHAQRHHAWLVLTEGERVIGYAYGGAFRARPAYAWSCEVSVYLSRDRHRTGGGRALYEALLSRLTDRGLHTALAGVALPNDASLALHKALGFETIGTFARVGWKNGRWHDVTWLQRHLAPSTHIPTAP